VWDYEKQDEGELALAKGDIIYNVTTDESGWWTGTLKNGVTGMFPHNFVEDYNGDAEPEPEPEPAPYIPPEPHHPTPAPAPAPGFPPGGVGMVGMMGINPLELRGRLKPSSDVISPRPEADHSSSTPTISSPPPSSTYASAQSVDFGGRGRGTGRGRGAPVEGGPGMGPPQPSLNDALNNRGALRGGRGRGVGAPASASASASAPAPAPVPAPAPAPEPVALPAVTPAGAGAPFGAPKGFPGQPMGPPIAGLSEALANRGRGGAGRGRGRGMRGGGVGGFEADVPQHHEPEPEPAPEPEVPPPFGAGEDCCRTEYDYDAQAEGELSFGVGVIIVILKRDESGWWQGKLEDGTTGWFPANFVVEIESPQAVYVPPPPTAMEMFDQVVQPTEKIKVPTRAKRPGKRLPSRDKRKLGCTVATKEDTEDSEPASKTVVVEEPAVRTGRSQTLATRGAPPPMQGIGGANTKTLTKRSSFGPNQLKAVNKTGPPEKILTQSESMAENSLQDRLRKRRDASEENTATDHSIADEGASLTASVDSSVARPMLRGRGRGRGAPGAAGHPPLHQDAHHEEAVVPASVAPVAVVETKQQEEKVEEVHEPEPAFNKFRGRGGLVRGRGGRPAGGPQEAETPHEVDTPKAEPAKIEPHRPAPTPSLAVHRPAPTPSLEAHRPAPGLPSSSSAPHAAPSVAAAAPSPAPAPSPSPAAPAPVLTASTIEEEPEKEADSGVSKARGRGGFGRGGLRRVGGEGLSTSGGEKVTSPSPFPGVQSDVVVSPLVSSGGPPCHAVNQKLIEALTSLCQKAATGKGIGAPNHRISQFVHKSGLASAYSVSVCTVDGAVWEYGDKGEYFTLQDCVYPFIYSLLLESKGAAFLESLVGEAPVAMPSLMISLNDKSKPYHSLMASGAMVLSNALYSDKGSPGQRLRFFLEKLSEMGGTRVTCDLPTYISCNISGDQHYALAYWLKGSSPSMRDSDPPKVLDFFFQLKSVETTSSTLAVLAAILANDGLRPGSGERILSQDVASRTVNLMKTCGMRAGSAEWTKKNGYCFSLFFYFVTLFLKYSFLDYRLFQAKVELP
jgi:glutaminase